LAIKIIDSAAVKEKGRANFERCLAGGGEQAEMGKGRGRVETNSSQKNGPTRF